jgi:ABC transport system ATP-binding/permease protein
LLLSVENLSKDFRFKPLFENASFNIGWTDRVGLIGVNGSGKTTLLRIIAGEEKQDAGKVIFADGKIIGYLPQNPQFDPEETVLDALFSRSGEVMQLIHDYEAVCEQITHDSDPKLIAKMSDLSQKIDAAGAWELETKAKVILSRLGIIELEAKVGELSGGQRKRIALAHALIVNPDLLILDEPTNHLDAETIEWLEEYLSRYAGGLLLVTHDRYFLDRVTNRILEVDRNDIRSYDGNYVYYLEAKAAEEERLATEEHKRKQLVKQELAWLRRGAKARTTKQKARIDRADELINAPKVQQKQELDIAVAGRRLGTKTIEFEDVSKGYDDKLLVKDFTYVVTRGESIGIIGPNGAGKTTLLDLITGRVQPDSGEVEIGPTVAIGYYDQESRTLNDDQRVIDYVREAGDHVMTSDGNTITAGQMLERFLFPPVMQFANIGKLSGGERRRLYLLRILMAAPNVLLLDEPTNDLDIPTLVALEDYLDNFNGVVIAVSHDRYFLDRVADHVFRFEGDGRIREYPGNYSAFLEIRDREERERTQAESAKKKSPVREIPKPAVVATPARKLSFKEKKELETLEIAIEKAEARKAEIGKVLSSETSDYSRIQQLSEEMQVIDAKLEKDMARWSELAELQ